MVSNHVMDLIERYGETRDPHELTDYVKARKFYDYKDHSREGAAHGEFVTDEIADRFSVIGSADAVKEKLQELDSIGVDHFNIYLMTHGQEEILETYGDSIIPELKQAASDGGDPQHLFDVRRRSGDWRRAAGLRDRAHVAGARGGVYVLVAPEPDRQQPHEDDEVYIVLEGSGTLQVEDEEIDLAEGQAMFVAAHAEHRFTAYERLSLLVIFTRPK